MVGAEVPRLEAVAMHSWGSQDLALLTLLRLLHDKHYEFVTPTPATHARVLARLERRQGRSLRDVFGWSLPFRSGEFAPEVEDLLAQADMLRSEGPLLRSRIRVSTLQGRIFLHSAYPTAESDAVFFGPDSYRFANLIRAELSRCPAKTGARIVDIGTGSGVGAVITSAACPSATVRMTDINPLAIRFARINAAAAGVRAAASQSATLEQIEGEIDIVTANPPFMIDGESRLYRNGGGSHGAQIAIDMTKMALDRLAPGGRMILYTGSAIVDGADALKGVLGRESSIRGFHLEYRELDPDVFSEELEQAAYADVERIALVGAIISRRL